jgi:hypothetical protein
VDAAAGNGHDAGEAIRELRRGNSEAVTVRELPEDAEVRDIALAYANIAAAQHERFRLLVGCLDALHADNQVQDQRLGKAVLSLKFEIGQVRQEAQRRHDEIEKKIEADREVAKKRHEEICALLKNLRGYA